MTPSSSVEILTDTFKNHQVVNQNAKENLLSPSLVGSSAQRRAQLPLVLRERAFDMDSLAVDVVRESALELTAVPPLGPFARPPHVDRSHQGADPEELPAELVMKLTVVGGVRQNLIERHSHGAFHHGRGEVGRIVAGTPAHLRRQPQIAPRMAEHGQLGKSAGPEMPGVATLAAIVEAYVPGFVPGGIHRPFGLLPDQAAAVGAIDDSVEQSIETPFLRRRW